MTDRPAPVELPDRGRRRQRRPAAVRRRDRGAGPPGRSRWTGGSRPAATRTLVRRPRALYGPRAAGSTRPTPRCCAASTPACRCWPACATAGDVVPGLGRPHAAALRAGHRRGRRLRPAAPLDAGRGRGRGLGRRTWRRPTRCWPAGEVALDAGQRARHGGADGHRARPVACRCWVVENQAGGTAPSRRSTRARATSPGSAGTPTRRSRGCASCATSPDRVLAEVVARPGPVDVLSARRAGRRRWATTSTCAPRPAPTC